MVVGLRKYDTMKYVNPPVHTVAVGTAWGEAAMLLASGEKVGGKQLLGAELTQKIINASREIGLHSLLRAS